MSNRERNKGVALKYFKAFVAGDKAWWEANVSPSFKRHDPGLPYQVIGPTGLQHHHDVLLTGVPDLNLPIYEVMEDNGKVLVRLRFRRTHKGEFFGYEPTDNAIDVEVFDLFQLGPIENQGIPTTTVSVIRAPKGVCYGPVQRDGRPMGENAAFRLGKAYGPWPHWRGRSVVCRSRVVDRPNRQSVA